MAADARVVVIAFGPSALPSPAAILAAARGLAAIHDEPAAVVAVLPAMGDATDDLVSLAHAVSPRPRDRELDMLVTTGARISCALCAMALLDLGKRAVSLSGSQAGIVTDTVHGAASIVGVRPQRLREELTAGAIVLVAGLQGVSTSSEVTSLRDARAAAAALAEALGAGEFLFVDEPDGDDDLLNAAVTASLPLERTA